AVMLTRMPLAPQTHVTSTLFRQSSVSPPAGYEFAVVLADEKTEGMWEKENLFAEKIQLYKAWGVSYVIEDVVIERSSASNGRLDFSLYAKRKDKLAEAGLTWTPRLRIGDLNALPPALTMPLQKAVGTDRPEEGPMLSIWDPRVVDLYTQVFDQMRMSINPNHLSRLILSFAGDWGPLFFSLESSQNRGWPDFWAGDPLAQRSFKDYLQKKYGNPNVVRAAWGGDVSSLNTIVPSISPDFSPQRNLDAYAWYRESMAIFISRILERAKLYFPQTHFILEIAEDFEFGGEDPSLIASLASHSGSSVVMIVRTPLAAASPIWGCFANACQRRGVSFGLRCIGRGGGDEMLSALYSLASDGGSLFYFSESFLVGEKSWSSYVNSISRIHRTRSNPRIAVVFPRTSMSVESPLAFLRIVSDLRDLFGFDVVDEADLGAISISDYPFILVPWGTIWTRDAVSNFERLARSGGALIAHADQPWQTVEGEVEFNEDLFAVKLVRSGDGWEMQPRTNNTRPYEGLNPIARTSRRMIALGESGDDVFLEGQWGDPQNEAAARQYGFPFSSFRWMGERGRINLPMRGGENYVLQIEGYIPPGRDVQVYINNKHAGAILGEGAFQWKQPITKEMRSRRGDVNLLLRGQLWSMGEVLGATQTRRVSMALSKVNIAPAGENPNQLESQTASPDRPEFRREALRGSWLRELGQGVTLLTPGEFVNEWVFRQMVNTIVMQPMILDPRYQFSFPPDGRSNDLYVRPLSGRSAVYLNLNAQSVRVGGWDRSQRERNIPPSGIFYSN
ncbi:MAG: hypothetical protein JXR73_10585, partial [Candidatus Omnitrophica bacterium]|nr:hypothetical protein [Candidatus Omnitrophota bacterium]